MVKDMLAPNAAIKSLQDYTYDNVGTSMLPVEIKPGTPPTLRQSSRFDYMTEYVDFWTLGVKSKAKSVAYFALGLLTINYFAPGALLMFALSARAYDVAWICEFINEKFGKYRTIITAD
ncbi:MAG: hypothetical protein WC607_03670 [Candidatus Micrarchaeia archaeon]